MCMNNWSIDEENLKKDPRAYAIWKIEQMVNFGLGKEKILQSEYKKYSKELSIQDPWRKKYIDLLVYEKDSN